MQFIREHIGRIELVEKREVETKAGDSTGSRISVYSA